MLSVRLEITSVFSGSSITLLYAVAGVDAIRVSLLDWINWRCALAGYSRGSQGEMFGNSQVLGGLASFAAALINSLLSGLSMKAPFIVCVLCLVAVAVWTMRLADAPISTWIGNWLIKKTS